LVFQSEDDLFWQLCDSGLGWSGYAKIEPAWAEAPQFRSLLPALVNPRPQVKAPWTFEIHFGTEAKLVVDLVDQTGQIRCEVRGAK
jgi:hypothetical protein